MAHISHFVRGAGPIHSCKLQPRSERILHTHTLIGRDLIGQELLSCIVCNNRSQPWFPIHNFKSHAGKGTSDKMSVHHCEMFCEPSKSISGSTGRPRNNLYLNVRHDHEIGLMSERGEYNE